MSTHESYVQAAQRISHVFKLFASQYEGMSWDEKEAWVVVVDQADGWVGWAVDQLAAGEGVRA